MRLALLVSACLLISTVAARALPPSPEHGVAPLHFGPTFAGSGIVWAERQGDGLALRLERDGQVAETVVRSPEEWKPGTLAGSDSRIVFRRTYTPCAPALGRACAVVGDVVSGPPRGPFVPLTQPRRCQSPERDELDVEGRLVALVLHECDAPVARVLVGRGEGESSFRVLREGVPTSICCAARIGGRFVAWREGSAIVVLDLDRARLVLRARPPRGDVPLAFDVDGSGTLVVASGRPGSDVAKVSWFSPSRPRPHRLPVLAQAPERGTVVRIVEGRVVVERILAGTRELVGVDLEGRVRTLFRFAPPVRRSGDFDFDGSRVTWAATRVTGARNDCPPPGSLAPCVRVESGTTTIWRAALSGTPAVVARLPFRDAVLVP